MQRVEGRIIKAIAGFYYVHTAAGLRQCRARGVFKKRGIKPRVGDFVMVEPHGLVEGTVDEVMTRKNELTRPPVANVDQVLLVFSLLQPTLSLYQLDKMLAMTALHGLKTLIALTKVDLPGADDVLQSVRAIYDPLGYPVIPLHVHSGLGVSALSAQLAGAVTVLAGQSGVGKSTILKTLIPEADAVTGAVSDASQRGKHTTTHVQLYPFAGGFVADTPGFSQYDLTMGELNQVHYLFREIGQHSASCVYRGCLHECEDGCAVRLAASEGRISASRYENYLLVLRELRDWKARRY